MPEGRPKQTEDVSPKQVAVHFTIGALLGTLGALFLVFTQAGRIPQLLWPDAAPVSAMIMFVAISALTVAIGASLTGVIFSAIEAEHAAAAAKRRPPHPRM